VKFRIISGIFGGRNIQAPEGTVTHPMSERVRNALFNIVGPQEIKGATVLDAFAGSGAIGLEALSRGARHVTFIDRDYTATRTIKDTITLLGINTSTTLITSTVSSWAKTVDEQFDLIIADPPYDDTQFSTVTELFRLLKPNGLMVLSYPGRGEAPTGTNGVVVVDNRSYGNAYLTFYRREE
jgi:16S rRNA (guanine966-N2)-methyltransferase